MSILFSQLCERNTHDVSSLLANVRENCFSISAQKTTKRIFFTISGQSENTDSDLKVHALHYANELLVRVRPKILQTSQIKRAETTRNYQKQVLVMINIVWQTHKLILPE